MGWHLTDQQNELTRWQFPSHVIDPNEYLVVFASGKDQAVSGSELHTSFRLGADGEYVALVQPDGTSISSEYAIGGVDYPQQFEDISYGISQAETSVPLIGDQATGKLRMCRLAATTQVGENRIDCQSRALPR